VETKETSGIFEGSGCHKWLEDEHFQGHCQIMWPIQVSALPTVFLKAWGRTDPKSGRKALMHTKCKSALANVLSQFSQPRGQHTYILNVGLYPVSRNAVDRLAKFRVNCNPRPALNSLLFRHFVGVQAQSTMLTKIHFLRCRRDKVRPAITQQFREALPERSPNRAL
jgi:hypothetical protein